MLSFIVPKAVSFITINVLAMMSGITSHMLRMPKPLGAGRYKYRPTPAGTNDKV